MYKIKLKAARVNAGFTRKEVAGKTGFSVSTIQNWETGRTLPKQPAIEMLCALYGTTYDRLDFNV